jgi:hypothetical protein
MAMRALPDLVIEVKRRHVSADGIALEVRATVLRQLGVFREPSSLLGRVLTALTHPVTIARAYFFSSRG